MRLEGRAAMGYFPTPSKVVNVLQTWLAFEPGGHVLDPCCGQGQALETLTRDADVTTYGIELDRHRADEAKAILDKVGKGAIEDARISNYTFGMLYLNPPYDHEKGERGARARKELSFLRRTTQYLAMDGVLVYIIPLRQLANAAAFLDNRFDRITVRRFPDPEWDHYKQCVVFARRIPGIRRGDDKGPDELTADDLEAMATGGQQDVPVLEPREWRDPSYTVPATDAPDLFRPGYLDPQDVMAELQDGRLWDQVRERTVGLDDVTHHPPLPLHKGHLAIMLASGELDGVMGWGDSLHLAKGHVKKITHVETNPVDTQEGRATKVKEREHYQVVVETLRPDGTFQQLE